MPTSSPSSILTISLSSLGFSWVRWPAYCSQRASSHKYIRNYDFSYNLPPPLGGRGDADFTVTAVLGHLTSNVSALTRLTTWLLADQISGLWRRSSTMGIMRSFRPVRCADHYFRSRRRFRYPQYLKPVESIYRTTRRWRAT